MTEIKKSLKQKMFEIMKDVERIEKDKKNTHQNYEYASEKIIKETIHSQLVEKEILFQLNAIDSKIENGVTWTKFTYSFTDLGSTDIISGEFMGTGNGRDDKGYYSSITGAIKYIMTSTFLIPTGDDPENDNQQPKPMLAKTAQPLSHDEYSQVMDEEDHNAEPYIPHIDEGMCPQCGSALVQRQGKYGMFWGCSNYPTCKYIEKKKK